MSNTRINESALRRATECAAECGEPIRMSRETRGMLEKHFLSNYPSYPTSSDRYEKEPMGGPGPLHTVFGVRVRVNESIPVGWVKGGSWLIIDVQSDSTKERARHVAKQWAEAMEKIPVDEVPPNHSWSGIQGVARNLDVLETLFTARDRAMTKKIAEDLDREIMAEVDDDTRTLPEPWRDPAQEWPEDEEQLMIAVTPDCGEPYTLKAYTGGGRIHDNSYRFSFSRDDCYLASAGMRLDAWMPHPSHPFDDPREAGRKRVDSEGEVNVEFSEDPDW